MSGREEVLRRIRAAIDDQAARPAIPRDYRAGGALPGDEVVGLFAARVDDYHATVHRTVDGSLPDVLATLLVGAGVDRLGVPGGLPDQWLAALPDDLEVVRDDGTLRHGELDALDAVVTGSAVGIAETGTVVLDGSADQGRRALTLVPDHHVCVVRAADVVQTVPEGLARLDPSRPLTLISGPSATSDIELDRVEGVHGPRVLDVVLVTGP